MSDDYVENLLNIFLEHGHQCLDHSDLSELVRTLHSQSESLRAENQKLREELDETHRVLGIKGEQK